MKSRPSLAFMLVLGVAISVSTALRAGEPGSSPPQKNLILPGEVFEVDGRTAFLLAPADGASADGPKPWILYSPTLPAYPDKAEKWMHEALHAEMVRRGYAKKPALLGRSRGGLWASAWAIAHPDLTAGVGGIYPVYDWRTYPGLTKAAVAYELTPEQLAARAADLCPIERIDVAARAGVPFCIIHGDDDKVVPLEPNSAELKKRYEAEGKGELVTLIVAPGQGHSFWEGFFHCQPLVDFLIARAKAEPTGGE
jgi:pimeloyl-ACP methyl ester carboxylesterase